MISFHRILFSVVFIFSIQLAKGNDGAFYAHGNQLIPIEESSVEVRKESLILSREGTKILVTVLYEFYNPGDEKTLLVGFEAASPSGDVDGTPKNGEHPYMDNFLVIMNNIPLEYQVAIVNDSTYFGENGFVQIEPENLQIDNPNAVDFRYVYYFNAKFNKGTNSILHTYSVELSGSTELRYQFTYILTAANRWANKQIDDFSLLIDLGDFQEFNIATTFFDSHSEWSVLGSGKSETIQGMEDHFLFVDRAHFAIRKGFLHFQKTDFHPKGELRLFDYYKYPIYEEFNSLENELPFSISQCDYISGCVDEQSKKILRNLPFAIRGYVFSTRELKNYFEKQTWYFPDPDYKGGIESLTEEEKMWVEKWSE